jgi:hypothetical protein
MMGFDASRRDPMFAVSDLFGPMGDQGASHPTITHLGHVARGVGPPT